jgi:hypothetical protein
LRRERLRHDWSWLRRGRSGLHNNWSRVHDHWSWLDWHIHGSRSQIDRSGGHINSVRVRTVIGTSETDKDPRAGLCTSPGLSEYQKDSESHDSLE